MQLPAAVQSIITKLQEAGFGAFAVGGCVRDVLLGRVPADWDVATNAKPEEIQRLFPKSFYTNKFGTVTVLTGVKTPPVLPLSGEALSRAAGRSKPLIEAELFNAPPDKGEIEGVSEVEVTTYRAEGAYRDQRHPETVRFVADLTEDLARRDFTINAMAMVPATPSRPARRDGLPLRKGEKGVTDPYVKHTVVIDDVRVIDLFGGMRDLNAKLIRAVGTPEERFREDALRLLRAVRLAAQLDFTIEAKTLGALTSQAPAVSAVSQERIRDELIKLVMSERPECGFNLLEKTGLLGVVLPELAEGVGVEQNKHHRYTVFEHNIKSLQFAAQFGYSLHVRLAALLHDIGKPRTRRFVPVRGGAPTAGDYTFYGHDVVGARMAERLLHRLRFSNELVTQVAHLVRRHMFYYDVGKVTEAGARRLLRRVGREYFDDLIKVRIAERKGSGVPKAEPYRLRHLQFLVEKAAQAPVTVGELAINGSDLLRELNLRPGPLIGGLLNALLAEVLDDPTKNTRAYLMARAAKLKDQDPAALKALGEAAKDETEKKREEEIRRKYRV